MTDLREFPVFLTMLLQKCPFLNNIFEDIRDKDKKLSCCTFSSSVLGVFQLQLPFLTSNWEEPPCFAGDTDVIDHRHKFS